MKRAAIVLSLVLVTVLGFSSCATLFSGGPQQTVNISADQADVHFKITNQNGLVVYDGTNPGKLSLPRKYSYNVEVTKNGFAMQTVAINQSVDGWFWGNCCLGGVVGMVIDYVTGNMWDLAPTKISVNMKVALSKTADGYLVTFYTRDDKLQLRSLDISLDRI